MTVFSTDSWMFDLQCFPEPRRPAHWCATWAKTARRWKLGRRRVPPPETEIHVEPSAQARFRSWSHLLRVPGRSRSDVSQGPSCFELERRLIIHRQEGHKAGQQTGIYELLQRRVAFLREQLPETNHITASSTSVHMKTCQNSGSPLLLDPKPSLTWPPDSRGFGTLYRRKSHL